ncbi:MAG: hypothetical protein GY810_26650, partial [Aureispira sp.]|nr:hypothetical protein [Aureispira sp.]
MTLKALLDTGATTTLINSKFVTKYKRHKCKPTSWKTTNGTFTTDKKVKIEFMIPELNDQRLVQTYVHETEKDMSYDIIIGMDLMQDLGIDILNSSGTIKWGDQEIHMRPRDTTLAEMLSTVKDPAAVEAETKRISDILDAKYEAANLKNIVKNTPVLDQQDKAALYTMLKKYKVLFDGHLGRWKRPPHTIHLK